MSTQVVRSAIQHHNQQQLEYFADKVKKTMIPVESNYVLRHVEEMIGYGQLKRDEHILEVGCGMGKFTLPLLKKGFKITGLDLNAFLLQKLLEYNNNRFPVPLIASDILEIPAEFNERFDRVIGFFTLHHFHHLETYFQAMARVLKPGGEILFIEPNAWNPLYYIQIAFTPTMNWKGDKGVAQMTRKNFVKAAQYADLEVTGLHKYGFFPPFMTNTAWGPKAERVLESFPPFKPVLPFQLVRLQKK